MVQAGAPLQPGAQIKGLQQSHSQHAALRKEQTFHEALEIVADGA